LVLLPFPVGNAIMILVGAVLIYLALKKGYEPLLLIPIGFGAILVNLPYGGLMDEGGILKIIYDAGILTEIFPILIFVGIGAMTDFGPLLERPSLLLFSIPAQLGISAAFLAAYLIGFTPYEAMSVGIIGAMDGPTAIYVTSRFAPSLLGPVTICAYSYMSMIPILQVPLSRFWVSKKERLARMKYMPGKYPQSIRVVFPIFVTIAASLVAPKGIPLIGSLMLGNFLRESGVVDRLAKSAENEISNVTLLLLGVTIGGTMMADQFLNLRTLLIFALGLFAFVVGLSSGLLAGKVAYHLSGGKINPLIGATGVSAFPMAARTAHMIGRSDDPDNWLLMHAMAANTGGQIASVVAGGAMLSLAPMFLGA
jgi:sodium ion-translocating decarboxylase beta subunit